MPVYTQFEGDYATLGIGARIRKHRKERGWTLQTLADQLSISIGTLSAIENEKLSLDVELFLTLSRTLEVPIDRFLPQSRTRHFHVTRRGTIEADTPFPIKLVHRSNATVVPYHNRLWPLAQPFVGKEMEPYMIDIAAIPDDQLNFISHHHEEFLFVLRGTVECLIKTPEGLRKDKLQAGDCTYFWSYLPHCIRSIGRDAARGIDLVHSPLEVADSELAHGRDGHAMYLIEASHKNVIEQIGGRIASTRQANGLSAEEFAPLIGISVRRMKAIENGQGHLSLELLLNICRSFRKPLEYFFASTSPERPFATVLRASQIRRLTPLKTQKGVPLPSCFPGATFTSLADAFPGAGMQPYLVALERRRHSAHKMQPHEGQEFVYVLHGAITLATGHNGEVVEETLFPGDACFLDSSVPHRFLEAKFHPLGKRGAELLVVMRRSLFTAAIARRRCVERRAAGHTLVP